MSLILCTPSETDVSAVSTVHLRAMDENLLTHAQFPSPEGLQFFHGWLERNTLEHLRDGDKGVLVAKDGETGEVVSFVKWLVHRPGEQEQVEEEEWPDVARAEYLDPYAKLTERVRNRAVGEEAAYYREFVFSLITLMFYSDITRDESWRDGGKRRHLYV